MSAKTKKCELCEDGVKKSGFVDFSMGSFKEIENHFEGESEYCSCALGVARNEKSKTKKTA